MRPSTRWHNGELTSSQAFRAPLVAAATSMRPTVCHRRLCNNPAMGAQAQGPGTLTFLFTDLVGSTEQLERLGDEEAIAITSMAMARLREVATQHGGEIVKNMGDGIMVAFASTLEAVACAVAMQNALCSEQTA